MSSSVQTRHPSTTLHVNRAFDVTVLHTLATSTIDSSLSHLIFPPHTRQAFKACLSDLKSSTAPKDVNFLIKHAKALKPHTLSGWAALLGVISSSLAAITFLSSIALSLSIAGLWSTFALLTLLGTFITTMFAIMSFLLMGSTIMAAGLASILLCSWVGLSTAPTIITRLGGGGGGGGKDTQTQLKDKKVEDTAVFSEPSHQDEDTMQQSQSHNVSRTESTSSQQQANYVLPKIKTSPTMKRQQHIEEVGTAEKIDTPEPKIVVR